MSFVSATRIVKASKGKDALLTTVSDEVLRGAVEEKIILDLKNEVLTIYENLIKLFLI